LHNVLSLGATQHSVGDAEKARTNPQERREAVIVSTSTDLVSARGCLVDRSLHGVLQRYLIDRLSASSSVLLSNGFFRKATAPARSAFACVMASSCAETNTIGIGVGRVSSRCCRSRPFMPGSFMSRMAHAVDSKSPRSRKSSAEPNVSTLKP